MWGIVCFLKYEKDIIFYLKRRQQQASNLFNNKRHQSKALTPFFGETKGSKTLIKSYNVGVGCNL